jgi:hypothetical protein
MTLKRKDSNQPELEQLWGRFLPPLTPEQIDLSIKLCQKIKARKQLERKLGF